MASLAPALAALHHPSHVLAVTNLYGIGRIVDALITRRTVAANGSTANGG